MIKVIFNTILMMILIFVLIILWGINPNILSANINITIGFVVKMLIFISLYRILKSFIGCFK